MGTGLGTFFDVYPRIQPENFPKYYSYAHNDWLQLLIETGAIGLTLAAAAVGIYFFSLIKIFRERRDPYVKAIGAGVLGSSAAIFTHSLVDFNFHIPANAFLFSVILGLGHAALHNRKYMNRETTLAPFRTLRTNLIIKCLLTGVLIFSAFFLGQQISYRYLAESACPTQINSVMELERNPSLERIKKALSYEPANSECRVKIAASLNSGKSGGYGIDVSIEETIHEIQKAISQNPSQANNYLLLGSQYYALSFYDKKSQKDYLDKAIGSYENAVFFNPRHYKTVFKTAAIWLDFSWETVDSGQKELYSEKGIALLGKSLTLVPQRWKEAVKIVYKNDKDKKVLNKLMPGSGNEGKYAEIRQLANQWWDNPE